MFSTNVGSFDRVLRVTAGLVLIALALFGVIGWWGYLGLVPLLTGVFATCPAYSLLGVRTCSLRS
jgi:hypothetical protein